MFGATELVRRKLLNQLEIICCIYTPYLVWRAKIWYGKPKVGSVVIGHPEMVTVRGSLISHEIVSRSHLTIQQCKRLSVKAFSEGLCWLLKVRGVHLPCH